MGAGQPAVQGGGQGHQAGGQVGHALHDAQGAGQQVQGLLEVQHGGGNQDETAEGGKNEE
jgi:hypothetical protein